MAFEVWQHGFSSAGLALQFGSKSLNRLFKAAIAHYGYNMISFLLLHEITPVSHSMWGSFKRLFIICAAVVYFGTPVSVWNMLASLIACIGVSVYSVTPQSKPAATVKKPDADNEKV